MKVPVLVCGIVGLSLAGAAPAQSASDDVRCMLLSAGFARAVKDENSKRASAMTGAFYLGRLSGRMSPTQLAAAIRAQGKGLSAKQAEPIMRACAARASAAERDMAAAAKQAAVGR